MQPYTLADAERDLRAALAVGDDDAIARAARHVDELDKAERRPLPTLHAAALWYAQQGYNVFPLQPGTKIPFKGTRGCKDATNDAAKVAAWWAGAPDANIGLATGHIVDVVDIDGLAGQQSRLASWDMFTALDVVGTALTPRPGGMHLFVPASGHGNKAGLLPGIDYRGRGGYVVVAPSRTEQGTYRFLAPLDTAHAVEAAA